MSLSKAECGKLGGRPRLPTLVERQQELLEAQNNEKEVMDTPGKLPDNHKELLKLYQLHRRSNGHEQIQEGARCDLITSGPGRSKGF